MRNQPGRFHDRLRADGDHVVNRYVSLQSLMDFPGTHGAITALDLTPEELTLLLYFRDLPDEETRNACLDALEDFLTH